MTIKKTELEWKIEEGKKTNDVENMIYDVFETYKVTQASAIFILSRVLHNINCQIDEDIEND